MLCFPRSVFPYFFQTATFEILRFFVFRVSFSCTCSNRNIWNTSLLVWCFILYLFLLQNVPILQNAIAFKSNHSNTMLPNMMVLALLQKLKIKYELSYQSTTRLKYIDKFDQLLITSQWTSTFDNTVRSLIHLTIFYLILCSKTFPIIYKIIIK